MSARGEAERLLEELLRAGAIPVLEGGRLRIEAPPGTLTAERREALAGCLPELRALVTARWRSRETCAAPRPCRRMTPCARPVAGRPCRTPATCCICGARLAPGHRYCCPGCADDRRTVAANHEGDP
ncbi:MAG: hypothetical protein M3Q71_00400 [Chloroflexota bacterium]|nr:hypothetical protein [Chloroflexota bacterium]